LALARTRELLKLPPGYRTAIVPASDTGAVEMALWSLLGARGVDVLGWEAFTRDWVTDIVEQLKLADVRALLAPYGELPDLAQVDFDRDVVFAWNGTTSGVCMPNADWIAADRKGLTICDATSAVFAVDIDWRKLDAATFSWQKVLGGEAQHGILILSPRAIERLESYTSPWPLPKLFRMTHDGRLNEALFEGSTINTPSMLCLEDYLDALAWVESIGGVMGTIARSNANAAAIADWVARTPWADFLAKVPETRSNTSVCLTIVDPEVLALPPGLRDAFAKRMAALLDKEGVAKDIASYRDAPSGLRIWTGATVEKSDVEALMPWLDWAFASVKQSLAKAA
jgi:phosphoserine aminotransferase